MQKFIIIILTFFSLVGLSQRTTVQCMQEIALSLQGSPYAANTLNISVEEKLTNHSDRFDCVTFVEYVIAQSIYHTTNEPFEKALTDLRYRNGKIDGYGSRIHYFSEWLEQANVSGLVSILNFKNAIPLSKQINFMSSHKHLYKNAKTKDWPKINASEKYVSNLVHPYIQKSSVKNIYADLKEMDLIAITTSIKGLDISHTGFVHFVDGFPHLLHASETKKRVIISEKPLAEYLNSNKTQTGIIVARVK